MKRRQPPSKPQYLVETSALRPALGSPSHKHNQHFAEAVKDGDLYTSVYIRMEFVRHWICYFIRAALLVAQCGDMANALYLLEQAFGRGAKDALALIQQQLMQCGSVTCDTSAEEIASLAIQLIERFDSVFPRMVANSCQCEIGDKSPDVDYNTILSDLHKFHEEFLDPVQDCKINKFLKARGEADTP
jgi:hypothetical protein